jgi:hypothetical protein
MKKSAKYKVGALAILITSCSSGGDVSKEKIEGCYGIGSVPILELSSGKVKAALSDQQVASYTRRDDENGSFVRFSSSIEVDQKKAPPAVVVASGEPMQTVVTLTRGKLTIPVPEHESDLGLVNLIKASAECSDLPS